MNRWLAPALFILALALLGGAKAYAQTVSAGASYYTVTADVPSPVSKDNSKIQLNSTSTLADPASHSVLMTVTLLNAKGDPVSHRPVKVSSSRGDADIIESTSKLVAQRAVGEEAKADNNISTDDSDDNGRVSFRITSFIPGSAEIDTVADSVVALSSSTVEFRPLPFPIYLTAAVKIPLVKNEVTLFSADYKNKNLSASQLQSADNINPTAKISIPSWLFLTIALFALLVLALLVITTYKVSAAKNFSRDDLSQEQRRAILRSEPKNAS